MEQNPTLPFRIYPLGDQGICIDWGNRIDPELNDVVLTLFEYLQERPLAGVYSLIPAYSSLGLVLEPELRMDAQAVDTVREQLESILQKLPATTSRTGRQLEVPVCYHPDLAPDLADLAARHDLYPQDVVDLHTSREYRVYLLGFLPGFPYMGIVDDRIATPRLEQPRQQVPAGSVGIAGNQTGIYPLESPGGWNLIGRTPLTLFDPGKTDDPVLFRPGDYVRFVPISLQAFHQYQATP
ncbi:MAG: 5-oxoprolinase subunit PxpB [Bacteroidetes bacterium]|nr:MAG: 5-oxoprolinase subunit PxpB [Bacteroidota bacterium]